MNSYYKGKTLFLEFNGLMIGLFYCCSIAFYKAARVTQALKWQVEDYCTILKDLIHKATTAPTIEVFNALKTYELLFQELQGRVKGKHQKADSARRDLMSVGLRSKGVV